MTYAGLEWTERFGSYYTVVSGWLTLAFQRDQIRQSGRYFVIGRANRIIGSTDTPEQAAQLAIEDAR